jgi:hypothetical protein
MMWIEPSTTQATTLAAIALTTPLMLLGAMLVTMPIVAHLLNRKAKRRLVFPNIELLRASAASQSSLFRMRRWLLLLLRTLAVLLIVAAFARPLWSSDPAVAAATDRGSAVVLVVDRSLSVEGSTGGVSGLTALKASADQVLAELTAGAEYANLVFADATPSAALPAMTSNLDVLRGDLDKLTISEQRADFTAAIATAGELLAEYAEVESGQLVVLTDLQRSNWSDVDFNALSAALPTGTKVTVLPGTDAPANNLAITAPRHEPAIPMRGQPAALSAKVQSFSDAVRDVAVTLRVNDRRLQTRTVTLQPGEVREIAFTHAFDRLGDQRVELSIEDDDLVGDNTAYLVVRVVDRLPVVLIGANDPNDSGTDAYFLSRAVAPRGGELDQYAVRYVSPGDAAAGQFDQAAAVILADSTPLSPSLLQALRTYLRGGGGVILFCDDGAVADQLAAIVSEPNSDEPVRLPWRPVDLRDLGRQGDWTHLGEADWRSPMLRFFDLPSQESLRQVGLRKVWRVDDVQDTMRVLVSFEDGSPAIGQTNVDTGSLVVCNFSPSLDASDLGKYGSFVALTQAMVQALTPAAGNAGNAAPGGPLAITGITGYTLDGDRPRVVGPGDKPIPDAALSTLGDSLIASIRNAERAGFYRVMQGDYTLAIAAVNVDPLESDPARLTEAELAERFNAAGARAALAGTGGTGDLLDLRGTPLWGYLALAAMALLACEMFVVGYFRR